MTTWSMRIARCIPKATNTHSEYVILIAFPLKQSLHERASVLPYTTYSAYLLNSLETARQKKKIATLNLFACNDKYA